MKGANLVSEFDQFWAGVKSLLPSGTQLQTWSATPKNRALPFRIDAINDSAVVVNATAGSGISKPRAIPKRDFEEVYLKWTEYCNGIIPRKHFAHTLGIK